MKENVVIIGGGIAAMESARQLLFLGYNPIVIEKDGCLGGHVGRWNRLFPDRSPASSVVEELESSISDANVFLETEVIYINRLTNAYNVMLNNGVNIVSRAILIASGFDLFNAARKEEYGYGVYDRVITNADLESWFNGNADSRIPEGISKIGFVHCVGSRDLKAGNNQCSKVCCVTAVKQAMEIKAHFPQAEVFSFYMDLRLFGRKYEDFYIDAQTKYGVHFVRGRVSEIAETIDGRIKIKTEDTLAGRPLELSLDLVVLMSGMAPPQRTKEFARMLNLDVDEDGFFKSRDNVCSIVRSNRSGVFYAGACTGPKTIPETIAEARSAALQIHQYLTAL